MDPVILLIIFISFFCTFLVIPFWIRKAKQIGIVWEDLNKHGEKKEVAGSGGMVVVLGTTIGIFLYIAVKTFYFHDPTNTVEILALLSVLFVSSFVGIVDDLFGWKKGGLSMRSRLILILFSAVPLMVINAGESTTLGIEFGVFYPLLLIPLGIVGATTTFNFLAGFNGLEAGQGIILISSISVVTFLTGNPWLSVVSLCMVASLIAFYFFNLNPAKVFPGDILTYSVGAFIACLAILGNIEKIVLFFFIPYFIEIILKIKGGVKNIHNFGVPNKDGSLELRYKKIYSLTHLSLFILKKFKKKVYENQVVWLIHIFQIIVILVGFWIFIF